MPHAPWGMIRLFSDNLGINKTRECLECLFPYPIGYKPFDLIHKIKIYQAAKKQKYAGKK